MSKFPKAVKIPREVHASRIKRDQQTVRAIQLGMGFRLFVILFELIGVILIHSSSLFLDAIASITDVASSIFLLICMKLAQRPPDTNHPFGHGRYEPMGGLLIGMLLVVLGGVMFFQQLVSSTYEEGHRHIQSWAWIFPAVAVILLEIAYRFLIRTAKKTHRPALAADAYHYRIDSLTSLLATIALIIAAFSPEWSVFVDRIGALLIALFMCGLGFVAIRDNFHQLMDKIPDSKYFDLVKQAAFKASGVQATEKIRIQHYGPDAHVDIDIEVMPNLTVDKAHKISQIVRLEIQKAWPDVRDVMVHIEPYYPNDH